MLKIVIVEDEDMLREGLVNYINWEELGFEVAGEAADGAEGLKVIEKTRPDVVMTDIKMPHMDGITMTERIIEQYGDIQVVIISGYDDFEFARRALKAGVKEYILKPVNLEQLKNVMNKVREEIEVRKEHMTEYHKLKDLEQYSREQLRDKLFSDLLLNNASLEDVRHTIELLDFAANEYSYMVGILEMEEFPIAAMDCDYLEVMEMDREFQEFAESCVDGSLPGCVVLKRTACERIICLAGADGDQVEETAAKITRCGRSTYGDNIRTAVTFSSSYHGIGRLKKAWIEVQKLHEERYMEKWNSVIAKQPGPDTGEITQESCTRRLLEEVKSGNREGIEEAVSMLDAWLNKEKVFSHMHLVVTVSSIFFEVVKLPETAGGDIKEVLGDPMDYYREIIAKTKRRELLAEFSQICFKIGDYFSEISEDRVTGALARALDYMKKEHSNESLMLKDVAAYAYISSSYLSIILKKETGKTFIEYLTDIRMEHAAKLLRETEFKNYEIAEACGFSNPTYFSTVFKNIYGISPSSYRRREKEASSNIQ